MDSNCLTIRIHSKWLSGFRNDGRKLCCAFGFQTDEGKTEFNVISWSEDPTPVNTVVWSEKYYLAACKHGLELGSFATPNTTAFPITAGDTFAIDQSWAIPPIQVNQNPQADKPDAFWFQNRMPASALVFKRVRNTVAPAYVLSMGAAPMPAGRYSITPNGDLAIFFSKKQSGTAFTMGSISSVACIVHYKEQNAVNIWYTEDGEWKIQDIVKSGDGFVRDEDWTRSNNAKL